MAYKGYQFIGSNDTFLYHLVSPLGIKIARFVYDTEDQIISIEAFHEELKVVKKYRFTEQAIVDLADQHLELIGDVVGEMNINTKEAKTIIINTVENLHIHSNELPPQSARNSEGKSGSTARQIPP